MTRLKNVIKLFPKPPIHTKKEKKLRERKIVCRYAQGNTSLQIGKYTTSKEIEMRKAKLSSHTF